MASTPGIVIESRRKPQTRRGTVSIVIDKEALRNAGIDPDDPPEEIIQHYHKGGSRDGELVMDLKEAADGE